MDALDLNERDKILWQECIAVGYPTLNNVRSIILAGFCRFYTDKNSCIIWNEAPGTTSRTALVMRSNFILHTQQLQVLDFIF